MAAHGSYILSEVTATSLQQISSELNKLAHHNQALNELLIPLTSGFSHELSDIPTLYRLEIRIFDVDDVLLNLMNIL